MAFCLVPDLIYPALTDVTAEALRSRGITQQAAQQMILYAFAAELTEAIDDEALRQQILARIGQRLPGGKA